ncbi:hypothetical protein TrVE_jg3024 [Triparma verrucosa]|uniref:Uncharacterized protein n=1 Tax=Triparma verrucosa TaxID=1606542 RepID=A0A9W7KVP4_9STRA|nr:hypothetical protein TrVE_jg3024 [Triparma verrucosa]
MDIVEDIVPECASSLAEGHFHTESPQPQTLNPSPLHNVNKSDLFSTVGHLLPLPCPLSSSPSPNHPSNHPSTVPLVYCDTVASGRPQKSIESHFSKNVLPYLANTHTTTSTTGSQSTAFVAEARQIIAEGTGARITGKASKDVVLFVGSGVTSAVTKLISLLPSSSNKPVLILGPLQHHSNLIPWRENNFLVIPAPVLPNSTAVDLPALRSLCETFSQSSSQEKYCSWNACSNVTGEVTDLSQIISVTKEFGFKNFVDYASAAPYLPINVNVPGSEVDAAFISPHKFLGGPGSSGILIIKKDLIPQTTPVTHQSGGGTVFYVTSSSHRFLSNRVERNEGGSPNVPSLIRAGLAFLLKRKVGTDYITSTDKRRRSEFESYVTSNCPNLVLLGKSVSSHLNLPTFSFLIKSGSRFLHYNYVSILLNDLFGIQCRGGCQCAGPTSQMLLGLGEQENDMIQEALLSKNEVLRPGYTRLSTPYYMSDATVDYVHRAVKFICEYGALFLLEYRIDLRTGEWRHKSRVGKPLGKERVWLNNFELNNINSVDIQKEEREEEEVYEEAFKNAERIVQDLKSDKKRVEKSLSMSKESGLSEQYEGLRWFLYPREAAEIIKETGGANTFVDDEKLEGIVRPGKSVQQPAPSPPLPLPPLGSAGDENKTYLFKEAEGHEGEATMAELEEGFEEGELTHRCVVWDGVDWTGIAEFLESPPVPPAPPVVAFQNTANAASERSAVGLKGNEKKPARGSENWTTATTVSPLPSPAPTPTPVPTTPSSTPAPTLRPTPTTKKKKPKKPPKKLLKKIGEAMMQWKMVNDGDRLLLGLSGGKDSLTLLHCLLDIQKRAPVKFEIACCTIDPLTASFDPSSLIPYVESLGVKYHYVKEAIIEKAQTAGKDGKVVTSLCSFCARMKRGLLYTTARENGYNKLVLAQHLDDCAESFLMSAIHNGFLRTMKANYQVGDEDLHVIRPLVYVRESMMRDYALEMELPVVNENCPACFEEPKERARIKKLLSKEETLSPSLFDNMRHTLLPLMDKDLSDNCREFSEKLINAGRRDHEILKGGEKRKEDLGVERGEEKKNGNLEDFTMEELEEELSRRKEVKRKKVQGAFCTVDGTCEMFE